MASENCKTAQQEVTTLILKTEYSTFPTDRSFLYELYAIILGAIVTSEAYRCYAQCSLHCA